MKNNFTPPTPAVMLTITCNTALFGQNSFAAGAGAGIATIAYATPVTCIGSAPPGFPMPRHYTGATQYHYF